VVRRRLALLDGTPTTADLRLGRRQHSAWRSSPRGRTAEPDALAALEQAARAL